MSKTEMALYASIFINVVLLYALAHTYFAARGYRKAYSLIAKDILKVRDSIARSNKKNN